MKPIETPDTNAIFQAEGCFDLPATKCHDPRTGLNYIQTVWELSPQELKQVNETGLIFVSVMGESIQPILVSTESILEEGEENANGVDD